MYLIHIRKAERITGLGFIPSAKINWIEKNNRNQYNVISCRFLCIQKLTNLNIHEPPAFYQLIQNGLKLFAHSGLSRNRMYANYLKVGSGRLIFPEMENILQHSFPCMKYHKALQISYNVLLQQYMLYVK